MEKIINATGFEPLLENIFKHLDFATLGPCLTVCRYWNQVVKNPTFLLKQLKFAKMPEDKLKKWKELAIRIPDDVNLTHSLSRCIFWALNHHKINGFLFPETAASALGLVPVLKFIASYTEIDFSGEATNGSSPLHYAADYGHLDALKFHATLIENIGTIENKIKWTPIHFGALSDNVEIMKYFHELGCDLKIPDIDGRTPLQCAIGYGKVEMVKYFHDVGHDLNNPIYRGFTPFLLAVYYSCLEVIEFLASVLENPFSRLDNGLSAFHLAAKYGCHNSLTCLLKIKNDPNVEILSTHPNLNKATPLHMAAQYGHLECVKVLTSFGSSPDVKRSDGYTPIHLASENGYEKVVEHLAKFTDNPNQPLSVNFNLQNETPLKMAIKKNHFKVVQVLLKTLSEKMNSDPILKILSERMNSNPQDTMNTLKLFG